MWIAKPLSALTESEQAAWEVALQQSRAREPSENAPLAQTLGWGHAIAAVAGRPYLVFDPEEKVGGLIFSTSTSSGDGVQLECINGPLLHWDSTAHAPRQLATFALAASKLHERFNNLIIKPRWSQENADRRTQALPIPPFAETQAATLHIQLSSDPDADFSSRLQRTIHIAENAGISAFSEALTISNLPEFALRLQLFGKARGFTVPPMIWFRALIERSSSQLKFHLVTATGAGIGTQLLITYYGDEAHFLFGHDWRGPTTPSQLSSSAVAHAFAIEEARRAGLRLYDFNGYVENAADDHPYAGVSRFKAQFGGKIVRYRVPEFRIQA